MKRTELIDLFDRARPALASSNVVPMLTNYCFDGERLLACNGTLAISIDCKTDFAAAASGRLLAQLLDQSSGADVEMQVKDAHLLVECGRTEMTFPMVAAADYTKVFDMPATGNGTELAIKRPASLRTALQALEFSLSDDTSRPETTAVRFVNDPDDDKWLNLYSFNNLTLSRADVELAKSIKLPKEGVLVPGEFCRQISKYIADKFTLEFGDGYALFSVADITISSALINPPTRVDVGKILEDHFPASRAKETVPIPSRFLSVVQRSCVVIDTKLDGQLRMSVGVKKGAADFFSRSVMAEVRDDMPLKDHPDAEIDLDPRAIRDAAAFYEGTKDKPGHLLFTDKCLVMTRGNMTFLAAALARAP